MSTKATKTYQGLTHRFRTAYMNDRIPKGKLRHDVKLKFCRVFGMTATTFKLKLSATGDRIPFTDLHCQWMETVNPLQVSEEVSSTEA